MKILIIQEKMIGDVLTSSILFEALKKEFPDAEMHYLIQKHTAPVVRGNLFIDRIIISNTSESDVSLKKLLSKENYDVVIDAYSKWSSGLLTLWSGAKTRIGLTKWFSWLTYTQHFSLIPESKHGIALALENRLQLLEPLMQSVPYQLKPKINVSQEERIRVKQRLDYFDVEDSKPLYMLNVLGSSKEKTYPPAYFATLLDALVSKQPEAQLLFNYIPPQLEDATEIFDLCNATTQQRIRMDLYGSSLREFIVITSFCDALVGNEGGAVNMAKALGVPTFAIFSPWVTTASWAINANDTKNVAIHLKAFYPEKFENYDKKIVKKNQEELYRLLVPSLIMPKFHRFLKAI